ncbi:MAG: helix-turn-helix domain-containing protein [Sphaerobacter sp.]|nr:helix-turn-helix domain-containing protein [Sphaerobacter sp.]
MTIIGQFHRVAEAVAARTAELLGADVAVVDERGITLASTEPGLVGLPFDAVRPGLAGGGLRVPLRLDSHAGQVIVGVPASGEVLSPRLVEALIELVINQAAVLEQLPERHELKDTFIHDLLLGRIGDEADVQRKAHILGMDFTRPRAVILIDAAAFILGPVADQRPEVADVQRRRRAQLVIASVVGFFDLPNDTICAYIGDGDVVVLKASSTQDLVAWTDDAGREQPGASWANLSALKRAAGALLARLRRDTGVNISVGIGRYHPGVRGLARSYQDARAALSLGRWFHGQNRVHCLDGLGMAAFVGVADERTKADLAQHLLSPLDHAPELLETLDAFFAEDCCPSSAAARLAIHRNTLSYRLDKVALLTGLDPRRFDDAVQIRLALLVRALHGTAA